MKEISLVLRFSDRKQGQAERAAAACETVARSGRTDHQGTGLSEISVSFILDFLANILFVFEKSPFPLRVIFNELNTKSSEEFPENLRKAIYTAQANAEFRKLAQFT